MKEKFEEKNSSDSEEKEHSVYFTRHSKSSYKTYGGILKSENPQSPVDSENQALPDLPEAGIELARAEAEKFFSKLDPQKDALFFVSSNEARALETANIYRQIAHEKEFEVIKPEHVRGDFAEKVGEGEIRVSRELSLNIKNILIESVFNPSLALESINWENVDEETKEKWKRARGIIDADDKGSFGANFFYYSEEVQKIFPELKTSREVFERKFQNLLKLAEFGMYKAKESGVAKNIKILAFGHENYVGYALNKYFGDHNIGNCETLAIEAGPEGISIERRGGKKEIRKQDM